MRNKSFNLPLPLRFKGAPLSTMAQIEAGANQQAVMLPKATKALAVSLARENGLPMTLVISAALYNFAKQGAGKRRTACLSLLGVPPGTFAR